MSDLPNCPLCGSEPWDLRGKAGYEPAHDVECTYCALGADEQEWRQIAALAATRDADDGAPTA